MSLFTVWNACATLALQAGAPPTSVGTSERFRLLDRPEAWVVALLLLPGLALLVWLGYRRERIAPRQRIILASLRFLALLFLCVVLMRPVWVRERQEVKQAEVLVLVDDSASMLRRDAYAGNNNERDQLRTLAGKAPETATRLELARAAVEKEVLPLAARGQYATRLFRFSDVLAPLPNLAELSGRGHATQIGTALSQALASHRGRHVTDIVLVSDGRSNAGLSPLEAARAAGSAGIPVHTLVVGDTRPERNVVVELIEVPPSALEGDEIEISVRVLGRGTQGVARTKVLLEELSSDGSSPRLLAEEEAELVEAGAKVSLFAPPGASDARTNERRFRVSVPPLEGETMKDDNSLEFSVRITPEKVRVLYVDGYPRWEYRYLKNLLLRSDANLVAQVFLLSATQDFAQESTAGVPSLQRVPTGRKELLESYDVIILGDVNPYRISPDPARCDEFLASLREFVERGGGLVMQAGEADNPRAFAGTPLEELLPVVLDSGLNPALENVQEGEFHALLEDPANPHEIVRLAPDPKINRTLWETDSGLRGFTWFYPVARAKPGAQVLLRHPTAQNSAGRYPLLVTGYFPAGRTLFLGVDSTWMWRYRYGDRFHERFWRNALRWVALGRLKSGDRRVQLETLRSNYNLDERVTLEARVLDEDFRPSERPVVEARLAAPDGTTSELVLHLVPDRAGVFRASFDVQRPGLYSAWIENEGLRSASTEFEVSLPSRENADPSPDPATMDSIASLSKGLALDVAHARDLASALSGHKDLREPIRSELDDAWDHWGTLLLALVLLASEWILRKRWELI